MPKTNMKRMRRRIKRHRKEKEEYGGPLIVVDDGNDVRFNIGSGRLAPWKGALTSEMATDHDGRGILRWIIEKSDFDETAKEIITEQLDSVWF